MGDEIVYFPQGHHLYLDTVRSKKLFEINNKTLPWAKLHLRVIIYDVSRFKPNGVRFVGSRIC